MSNRNLRKPHFFHWLLLFPLKKKMIYICKEMRMNQQLGTFHYNWNDISLWLDHYSLTGAGYGSLDSLQIPHIWGSRLALWSLDLFIWRHIAKFKLAFVFWPLPYLGNLRFCTSQNGELFALKCWLENYRFLLTLLTVNLVNVNTKLEMYRFYLVKIWKHLANTFYFINNTKRRSVLVSVLFVWRNFRC